MITLQCETCERDFQVKPGSVGEARFCSIGCAAKWRKTLVGETNPNWKGGKTNLRCDWCGDLFEAYESNRCCEHVFCSLECYHGWQSKRKTHEWAEEEIELIRKYYTHPEWNLGEFADRLDRSRKAISRKAAELELTRPNWSNQLKLKRALYHHYKSHNAGSRDLVFDITWAQFLKIIEEPCHYCGRTKSGAYSRHNWGILRYNGLDRIDSGGDYTLDNVVPCCGQCNRAKMEYSYDDFRSWIRSVYHRWGHNGKTKTD